MTTTEQYLKLFDAIKTNNVQAAEKVLPFIRNINIFYKGWGTALHVAAAQNYILSDTRIFELLLKNGADINAYTSKKDKERPLHVFLNRMISRKYNVKDSSKFIKFLLDHGADINAKSSYNKTALHFAVDHAWRNDDNTELVAFVLKCGAKVNVASTLKDVPLYWAIMAKNIKCIKTLLEAGANVKKVKRWSFEKIESVDALFARLFARLEKTRDNTYFDIIQLLKSYC